MTPALADRDLRQREIVPPAKLAEVQALIIGVGAIGRQVALQLAAIGVPYIAMYDHDVVEVVNLAPQGYWPADIGRTKVQATADVLRVINSDVIVDTYAERFRRNGFRSMNGSGRLAVFCCVDSIATRKMIWDAVRQRAAFFADGRMSAEVIRVLSSDRPASDTQYAGTLFTATEAFNGSCTAKSTVYTASIAAGLMVSQLTRWLRDIPVEPDFTLNLLSAELTVEQPAQA